MTVKGHPEFAIVPSLGRVKLDLPEKLGQKHMAECSGVNSVCCGEPKTQ